jgi:hypothetical protein
MTQQPFDLDNLAHLEEMFIEYGRDDGIRDGVHAGVMEGRVLGCEQGIAIGLELGYYTGITHVYLDLITTNNIDVSSRVHKNLVVFQEMLSTFPKDNQEVGIGELVEKIRGKFKAIATSLAIPKGLSLDELYAVKPLKLGY